MEKKIDVQTPINTDVKALFVLVSLVTIAMMKNYGHNEIVYQYDRIFPCQWRTTSTWANNLQWFPWNSWIFVSHDRLQHSQDETEIQNQKYQFWHIQKQCVVITGQMTKTHLQAIVRPGRMHYAHKDFSPLHVRITGRPRTSIFRLSWGRINRYFVIYWTLISVRDTIRLLGPMKRKCFSGRGPCYRYEFLWKWFYIYHKGMISNHLK